MQWIYLSPHFDDAALSCGGLIWEQIQASEGVDIWTICAGDPPDEDLSEFAELKHRSWQIDRKAVDQRRREDRDSAKVLGAGVRYYRIFDCIYRKDSLSGDFIYNSEASLWGPLHQSDLAIIHPLSKELNRNLPPQVNVVSPLGFGHHVDHLLTRAAAEKIARPLWYYLDFPYVLQEPEKSAELHQLGWLQDVFPISEAGISAWVEAIAMYKSQISTFWSGLEEMEVDIRRYCLKMGGLTLWRKPSLETSLG